MQVSDVFSREGGGGTEVTSVFPYKFFMTTDFLQSLLSGA